MPLENTRKVFLMLLLYGEFTACEAKEKYKGLRDKYTRMKNALKKPSGSGRSKKNKKQEEDDKKFLAALSFLDPFTKKRR